MPKRLESLIKAISITAWVFICTFAVKFYGIVGINLILLSLNAILFHFLYIIYKIDDDEFQTCYMTLVLIGIGILITIMYFVNT